MRSIPIRLVAAGGIYIAAIVSLEAGVTLSGAEGSQSRSLLVDAYYALSLFVVGGIDIGTPQEGPLWALALLWSAYFAAPILAVSTLLDLILGLFTQRRWRFRRLKDHVIIEGDDELTRAYLRHLRELDSKRSVVVVSRRGFDVTPEAQLRRKFDALTWEGDLIDAFTLEQLRAHSATKILLFSDDSLRNFETVKAMLDRWPELAGKIVMHADRLRFMRSMSSTRVATAVTVFNGYQSAAENLVNTVAVPHVLQCDTKVAVVIAGFGRFGQTTLESLQNAVPDRLAAIILIEQDAERRLLVTREQIHISTDFELKVLQGDISHPGVWETVSELWDTTCRNTVFILATDREEDNLRTSLWLRRRNAEAMIFARLKRSSSFAEEVAEDHDIIALGLSQLIERAIPESWVS